MSIEGRDLVAIALALGLASAVVLVTIGVGPSLSDNATALLETAFGGVIGVVGAYLGYRAGSEQRPSPPAGDAWEQGPVDTPEVVVLEEEERP